MENKARVDTRNDKGFMPLHDAVLSGYSKTAQLLISHGADVNAKDKQGKTPLQWALEAKQEAVVELLRQHGATE